MYFVLRVALNQFSCLIPSVTTVILYLRLYLRCFNIACGRLLFWRKKKHLDVLSTGLKILNPLFKKKSKLHLSVCLLKPSQKWHYKFDLYSTTAKNDVQLTFHPRFSKNVHKRDCPVVFPPQGPVNKYSQWICH